MTNTGTDYKLTAIKEKLTRANAQINVSFSWLVHQTGISRKELFTLVPLCGFVICEGVGGTIIQGKKPINKEPTPPAHDANGQTCRFCANRERFLYGNIVRHYCKKIEAHNNAKMLEIGLKTSVCELFKNRYLEVK